METKVHFMVSRFSNRIGFEPVLSDKFDEISKEKSQQKTLQMAFPSFIIGALTQGSMEGLDGLHGPFSIINIPNYQALVHLFYLKDPEADLPTQENLHLLFIYYHVALEGVINVDLRFQLEALITQWVQSEVVKVTNLNKKRFKSICKEITATIAFAREKELELMETEIAVSALANNFLQVNKLLGQVTKRVELIIHSDTQLLQGLNPLIFSSLVRQDKFSNVYFLQNPTGRHVLDLGNIKINHRQTLVLGSDASSSYDSIPDLIREGLTRDMFGVMPSTETLNFHFIFLIVQKKPKESLKALLERYEEPLNRPIYLFINSKDPKEFESCQKLVADFSPDPIELVPLKFGKEQPTILEVCQTLADVLMNQLLTQML